MEDRVIVTVKRKNESRVRDLEIPCTLASSQLAKLIATSLTWEQSSDSAESRFRIYADPPGRELSPSETLDAAGVGDGAWLVFLTAGETYPDVPVKDPTKPKTGIQLVPDGPVTCFKPLIPDQGSPPSTSGSNNSVNDTSNQASTGNGFQWKQLD